MDLGLQSVLFVLVVVDEPLGEAGAPSSVLEQNETNLSIPLALPFESSFGFKYIYIYHEQKHQKGTQDGLHHQKGNTSTVKERDVQGGLETAAEKSPCHCGNKDRQKIWTNRLVFA